MVQTGLTCTISRWRKAVEVGDDHVEKYGLETDLLT
jgi:hypothetical protein